MLAYGVEDPRLYELDHAVPLSIGGAPADPRNLFPEPWIGPNNARLKDRVEWKLHRLVCQGRLPLAEAQARISADWRTALDGLESQ
jgi:hypothetical protein